MDIKTRILLPILWQIDKLLPPSNHPFNKPGDLWENLFFWQYQTVSKTLNHFSIDLVDKIILDVGCGPGGKSAYLANLGNVVIGIDINSKAIRKGKTLIQRHFPHLKEKVVLKVDNAYNLNMENNLVDIVFMDDVWEHIEKPRKAFEEIIRVTKPGGFILLAFPPLNHPWAAHVNDLIPIPWIHYLIWEKYILRWYIHKALQLENGIERLKFKGIKPADRTIKYINHMTLKRTLAIFEGYRDKLDLVNFSYDLLKLPGAKIFSKLGTWGLFFMSKYYFTLRKKGISK